LSESDLSIELFQKTPFKFALQKNGELTQISLSVLENATNLNLKERIDSVGRRLFFTIQNEIGIALARNKAISQLVASGSVDAGIVGLDQVYESGLKDQLLILREFKEVGEWDIVLATPEDRNFASISEILVVATQYPVIAQAFFCFN